MSGSVNKVILLGNLCSDPEIKRTQAGNPIVNMRLATSESWRDKNTGERKENAQFHNVVIFNEALCKLAEGYTRKGTKVYIEGQLATRKWTDKNGNERYSTEVVLQGFNSTLVLVDGPQRDAPREHAKGNFKQPPTARGKPPASWEEDLNDEVPF